MELTREKAQAEITNGCNQLVINALINDLATARVRIAELESAMAKADAPTTE